MLSVSLLICMFVHQGLATTVREVVIAMIFLSELLKESIYDSTNHRIGTLSDVCVSLHETFPVVTALIVNPSLGSHKLIIAWSQVQSIEESPLHLTVKQSGITPYEPQAEEFLLKRDILDKQIVDTQGIRVVKVNDLKLAQIKKTARLVGVDIGLSGLLRRLGLQSAMNAFHRISAKDWHERLVTWNYVEPIQVTYALTSPVLAEVGNGGVVPQVQLNVSRTKLTDLRPADIADILEQLDIEEAEAMLDRLDNEKAADTLNELEYPIQSELLSELEPERASDLLKRLAPDDAADILAEMPRAKAELLLNLMPASEAQPIRDLLRHDAQTAGGIMTNEILALSQESTVEDALVYLRQHSAHLEMIYYLYIVDHEQHLVGVLSLRQLVTTEPTVHLQDLMNRDVIKVQIETDQEEVAHLIARYDLLALPVVDAEQHLLGLITVDDVIDVIHEEQAEDYSEMSGTKVGESNNEEGFSVRIAVSRFCWQAINVIAGFILALIVSQILHPFLDLTTAFAMQAGSLFGLTSRIAAAEVIYLIPMLMLTIGSVGSQSLAVAGWELRTKRGKDFLRFLLREVFHGTVGGVLTSILIMTLTWLLFRSVVFSVTVGLATGLTLLIAAICGMVLPNVLQRVRLRGSWIAAPLLDPMIAVMSLSVFLLVTLTLLTQFGG
jgi:magnesium transporter